MCSRRPHRTFVPLSPSCRAIIQVETRSLCIHGSRCPLWRRTAAVAVCSRRPHRTFVPLSQSCRAGSFKSRRARCALMVLDALLWRRAAAVAVCVLAVHIGRLYRSRHRAGQSVKSRRAVCAHGARCPSLASGRRRRCALAVHIGRLYRSRHRAGQSFKSRRARCAFMVLDALLWRRTAAALSSRRPAIVQGGIVQVETRLILRSWRSMPFFGVGLPPSLSSRRPHWTFIPLSPSCKAISL